MSDAAAPTQPPVEHTEEHKKHGLGAIVEKITHPLHHHDDKGKHPEGTAHTTATEDTPSVPVAVPEQPSDGAAKLQPAGGVGGVL
uniref:Uncharacterized protein n=1 Tax=Mycena chlorophos TaxID=658473 RepID=A0ABQ0KWI9_MYCCL|nr:predicted protein [Mycena chlorophos]